MKRFLNKNYKILIVIIIFLFFILSLINANDETLTFDEKAHITAAYSYVKYNDMRLNPEHPPLLKDLAGLPLLSMDLNFPAENKLWTDGVNEQWSLGDIFINNNNADKITFWSRFPIILISLLLGFFIFQWAKELAGVAAGLFALILYSADPNILGHNHYVTTDLGIAAFIFIAFYFFIKFLKNPGWKNTLLAGIFLGLAQLTKFSAVLIFPLFTAFLVAYALMRKKPGFEKNSELKFKGIKLWDYIKKYVLILIICFGIIWIIYYLNTLNMPPDKIQEVATSYISDKREIGREVKLILSQLGNVSILKPLVDYFWGVAMVVTRVAGGNDYYFMGKVSSDASPSYFPIVFLIKETLPFLFLLLLTSLFAIFQIIKNIAGQEGNLFRKLWVVLVNYLRTGLTQYAMLGFIFLYAFLSITGNLNIGFRHLFPMMPFLYVLMSKKVFDFLKSIKHDITRKKFHFLLAVFIIWVIFIPVVNFPSYLSYFNETAGGPKNGHKYVTDSNADWGQDLKRLNNWINEYNKCSDLMKTNSMICKNFSSVSPHPTFGRIDKIRVDYFGGVSPEYYLGDKYISWHSNYDPEPGWYAISINFMQGDLYKKKSPGDKNYDWTLKYNPIRVGDSIFVYYVE